MGDLNALEIWAVLGVLLLILEIFATSFFFIFFGLGALATALLTYLDVTEDLPSQVIAFLIFSAGSLLLFRKQLKELFYRRGGEYTEMVNEKAKVSVEIPENGTGKVFFRGTDWLAESKNQVAIEAGKMVSIKEVDGIKLIVEAI
ncbi:NfeD family protein [Marinilongibacter aquaticus]|uniref:NfeD family protein n=1 Tax=Marinilongibacter aquaticus TaxID=2975157 RepID=UPI0021BD299F|nr:NfeD family protein [Marinilongibacter aquaticus]UBM60279.1 NfeD family protein [Marinilongibacter aquaticus]